jgi:CrcB protein
MRFNLSVLWQQGLEMLAVTSQSPAVRTPIAISLGAIAGALSRYYITTWFREQWGNSWPWGTLFINLTGCVGMGFFVTLVLEKFPTLMPEVRLTIAVGFLGSYTTFSTYGLETVIQLRDRGILPGMMYWGGSAFLGAIAAYLGIILARAR